MYYALLSAHGYRMHFGACNSIHVFRPLFFRAPWITSSVGKKSKALAELVDLAPTLWELAGLPMPTGPAGASLGGTSLVPVFYDPAASVKDVALSQFPRCWQNNTGHDGNSITAPGMPFGGPGDERNKTNSIMSMCVHSINDDKNE